VEMSSGIGTMNGIMGWPADMQASPRAGEELLTFLVERFADLRDAVQRHAAAPSPDLSELLDAVLAADPDLRCSAAQALRSRWLAGGDDGLARTAPAAGGHVEEDAALSPPPPRPQGSARRPASRVSRTAGLLVVPVGRAARVLPYWRRRHDQRRR